MKCLSCGHDCGDVPFCPNCDRRGGARDPEAQPPLDAYAYARLILRLAAGALTQLELDAYDAWGRLAVQRYPVLGIPNLDISFQPNRKGATS